MRYGKLRLLDDISMALMLFASLSIIFSLITDYRSESKTVILISYLSSALFWLSLLIGWIIKLYLFRRLKKDKKITGMLNPVRFFSALPAVVADAGLIVSVVLFVVFLSRNSSVTAQTMVLSAMTFALQMHLALNGKVFKYIHSKDLEEKKNDGKC